MRRECVSGAAQSEISGQGQGASSRAEAVLGRPERAQTRFYVPV